MVARDRIVALREANPSVSAAEIARTLGVSRERVRQILKSLGMPTTVFPTPSAASQFAKHRPASMFGKHVPGCSVGAFCELIVCADLLSRGLDVFRSVARVSRCDIVAISRKNGKCLRVEVKSAQFRQDGSLVKPSGSFNSYDVIAAVVPCGDIYYLPDETVFDPMECEPSEAAGDWAEG